MKNLVKWRKIPLHGALALAWALSPALLPAQEKPENLEFFEKRIRPVLVERCYPCHGPAARPPKAGLRLDSAQGWRTGGERGPEIVPGDPEASRLIQAIRYQNPDLQMPPAGRLALEQIADLEAWVKMGAPDPRIESASAAPAAGKKAINLAQARRHWAFQPPKEANLPTVREQAWVRTPVDALLLKRLEEKNLKPAPPADRPTLIRRATFDLIGLPPTPGEIDDFVRDTSPQAWHKVIDRLLASPHYGERWGRHWLDLVRFAETDGHEFDMEKPNAWRYRDYVIRAFNDDLPYRQFVLEQLAGDLLGEHRVSGEIDQPAIGTGFYWLGEVINSPVDSVQALADRTDNQIDVIGKTFLGLTVACARCHDHKFDPIPTADYYALAGFMQSSRLRQSAVDTPQQRAKVDQLAHEIARLRPQTPAAADPIEKRLDSKYDVFEDFSDASRNTWSLTGPAFEIRDGVLTSGRVSDALEGLALSRQFVVGKQFLHILMRGEGEVRIAIDEYKDRNRTRKGGPAWQWKTVDLKMCIGRSAYFEVADLNRKGHLEVESIVFSDEKEPPSVMPAEAGSAAPASDEIASLEAQLPPSHFALITADYDPHNVHVYIRGSHKNLGAEAPRKFLTVLAGDKQPSISEGSGRLELARHIADESSPLLARVMVNRIWEHHFGQGIVGTPDNFGLTGESPSHPELLDYLAIEFARNGWSIKSMHRLMMLSNAYQMSSNPDHAAYEEADPQNKLLHRMPVRRLEAEAIRDSILAVSGRLDSAVYGPGVLPYITPYMDGDPRGKPKSGPLDGSGRRSIYVQVRRNYLSDFLTTFDFPPPISTMGKRNISTVPSQALFLMNNEFVSAQAGNWAERVLQTGGSPQQRVAHMYSDAFGRAPLPEETAEAVAFVAPLESRYATISAKESSERRAWTDLAHVLFNTTEFTFIR